jgi:thiol-disulfide isomerase/thioredoxin
MTTTAPQQTHAKDISLTDFEVLKHTKGLVFIDFWAVWCGPCKVMGPVIDQMMPDFPMVNFVKVNVDEVGELANLFGVQSIPTFYMLNLPGDGTFDLKRDAVGKMIGSVSPFDFKQGIDQLVKKSQSA